MPRTADHIVATHRIARRRVAEGKSVWSRRIDVSDVFHSETLTFEERRNAIVKRLKNTGWYQQADPAEFDGVHDVINELGGAEDAEEFDGWWDELYDLADHDRVYIRTS
jgi:alkylation response protein AidB-like acyl-CoA dehydrogenase